MQQSADSQSTAISAAVFSAAPADAYSALVASLRAQASAFRFERPDDTDYFARSYRGRPPAPMPMVNCNLSVIEQVLIERTLVRCAVTEILAAHPLRSVRIHDGFEYVTVATRCLATIMKAVMSTDENTVEVLFSYSASGIAASCLGVVQLRYGGPVGSVIVDATVNIRLERTDALAAAMAALV